MEAKKNTPAADQGSWETRMDILVDEANVAGSVWNDNFLLVVDKDGTNPHSIHVIEKKSDLVVAFSSMKADFEQSLREFVEDYIT